MARAAIRYRDLVALRDRYAPATVNLTLCAVRRTLRAAWLDGAMLESDYRRAVEVANVTGSRQPSGRALGHGELAALFRACSDDRSPAGGRDAAALALMFGAGLRRAEAAALDLADYDSDNGTLRVIGKRDRERTAYVVKGGRAALDYWLKFRGDDPGPLLVPVSKSGTITLRRMTTQALLLRLRLRCQQAGVQRCSPHDLRRSFVSGLLDRWVDLGTVQDLAGHADPKTTRLYDRRGDEVRRQGATRLHVPFQAPR